jgi:hypothetical protein
MRFDLKRWRTWAGMLLFVSITLYVGTDGRTGQVERVLEQVANAAAGALFLLLFAVGCWEALRPLLRRLGRGDDGG